MSRATSGDEGAGPDGAGPLPRSGGPEIPAPLHRFVDLFDAGEYWESHEALEGPWRQGGSRFYQGLILYASAWVHVERNNAHGIDAQMRKALEALDGLPDAYLGVDVEAVRSEARRVREVVARRRGPDAPTWSTELEPPPLLLDPARVRGDEIELGPGAGG